MSIFFPTFVLLLILVLLTSSLGAVCYPAYNTRHSNLTRHGCNYMKPATLLSLALLTTAEALVVDPSARFICDPQDPTDCYPQIFVPTSEWQPIRHGQDIPAGLHVRINMDTLQREAKLMEEEDSTSQNNVGQVDGNHDEASVPAVYQSGDVSTFEGAVKKVMNANMGLDADLSSEDFEAAVETLVDLSHDREHGIRLAQDRHIFAGMLDRAQSAPLKLREKYFRIMGASLRNNPEAVDAVLKVQKPEFVDHLFGYLENKEEDDVVKKRIISIIHALSSNVSFRLQYLSYLRGRGIDRLVDIFTDLLEGSQVRIVNILEDLGLVDGLQKRDDESPQAGFSSFVQSALQGHKVRGETQLQLYFNKLVQLHKQHQDLKPSPEFLLWLAEEANVRVESHRERRDISPEDKQFDQNMLAARHEVFGNPNAMRKAYVDEL